MKGGAILHLRDGGGGDHKKENKKAMRSNDGSFTTQARRWASGYKWNRGLKIRDHLGSGGVKIKGRQVG